MYHTAMSKRRKMNLSEAMRRARSGFAEVEAKRNASEDLRRSMQSLKDSFSFLKTISGRKLLTIIEVLGFEQCKLLAKSHQSTYLFMQKCSSLLITRNAELV